MAPRLPQDSPGQPTVGVGASFSVEGAMGPQHRASWREPRDQVTVAGSGAGDFYIINPSVVLIF